MRFNQQWFRLIGIVILFPAAFTYLHFWNWLRTQQCVLVRYNNKNSRQVHCAPAGIPVAGILEYPLPPSIATLSTWLSSSLVRSSSSKHVSWDGTKWQQIVSPDERFVEIVDFTPSKQQQEPQDLTQEEDSSINKYGFRRNRNKKSGLKHRQPFPVTTGFFLLLNIGLFLIYWQRQVDPTDVALNAQVYQDYGRAFSGNLAHFELWHLGFNVLSLSTLGMVLEQRVYGSIPLMLFTLSFLPLTTLCVVGMYHVRQTRCDQSASFPNMVGFSGILFAWMVVATLQTQQTSCPIFFLPDVCFDTYHIGGISVSLGPLVQLFVAQIILPRVSFMGHLAGILVGFAWHVHLFPSLEWTQPCVSYPVLWMIGKLRMSRHPSNSTISDGVPNTATTTAIAPMLRLLRHLRNVMLLHCLMMIHQYSPAWNSLAVSEGLLICILSYAVRDGHTNNNYLGTVGRGYVVLVLVVWMTDSMTLGGWLVSRSLWRMDTLFWMMIMMVTRGIFWWSSISLMCHLLTVLQEIPTSGSWKYIVWWIVEPCCGRPSKVLEWMNRKKHPSHESKSPTTTTAVETSHLV